MPAVMLAETDNDVGTGTVSNNIDELKKGVQGSDYESVRELRIKNYIKQLGEVDEERVEQFITRCANSQDPQKPVDVLEKMGHIDLSGVVCHFPTANVLWPYLRSVAPIVVFSFGIMPLYPGKPIAISVIPTIPNE
jgi:hypothetical protein